MSCIDVMDETFLAVPPAALAAEFAQPATWRSLWPDLRPAVMTDRGPAGMRVDGHGCAGGQHRGVAGGRAGRHGAAPLPACGPHPGTSAAKAIGFALKARLEAGRAPGEPPR